MRNRWPKRRFGYTDMGKARIPPQPAFVQLEDRDDGTVWTLLRNEAGTHLTISDAALSRVLQLEAHGFGAFDGPWIKGAHSPVSLRLFVRGGRPGYEVVPTSTDVYSSHPPPMGRRAYLPAWLRLIVPTGWKVAGDRIAMEDVTP